MNCIYICRGSEYQIVFPGFFFQGAPRLIQREGVDMIIINFWPKAHKALHTHSGTVLSQLHSLG